MTLFVQSEERLKVQIGCICPGYFRMMHPVQADIGPKQVQIGCKI